MRQGEQLVDRKGSFYVKFLLKSRQNDYTECTPTGKSTENTYAYDHQHERFQGMLLTTNGDDIMETQKWPAIDNLFSTRREYIENAC